MVRWDLPGMAPGRDDREAMPPKRTQGAPSPKRRTPTRCSYQEGGRRCPYEGAGEPALCPPHRLALQEAARPRSPIERLGGTVIDFLQGNPINRDDTLGAVQEIFQQWSGTIGSEYRPTSGPPPGYTWGQPPGQGGRGASIDPNAEARRAARQVMGFAASEPLTEDLISARKRQLAKRHHPDRGGSVEKMAAINDAADILLAAL